MDGSDLGLLAQHPYSNKITEKDADETADKEQIEIVLLDNNGNIDWTQCTWWKTIKYTYPAQRAIMGDCFAIDLVGSAGCATGGFAKSLGLAESSTTRLRREDAAANRQRFANLFGCDLPLRRADVFGHRADQSIVTVLLENVCRPAGHPADGENRGEEIDRDA